MNDLTEAFGKGREGEIFHEQDSHLRLSDSGVGSRVQDLGTINPQPAYTLNPQLYPPNLAKAFGEGREREVFHEQDAPERADGRVRRANLKNMI